MLGFRLFSSRFFDAVCFEFGLSKNMASCFAGRSPCFESYLESSWCSIRTWKFWYLYKVCELRLGG